MHFLKLQQFIYYSCFLWFVLLILPYPIAAQNVEIPDLNLRVVIEKALGKDRNVIQATIETEEGEVEVPPITADEMETLTHLNADNVAIQNLTGIEYAINLEILEIKDNIITDLSPLNGLIKLKELNISDNVISDLSPLAGMLRLNSLSIHDNPISDLSPLTELISLNNLHAYRTSISDLSPLTGLLKLHRLNVSHNPLLDINTITGIISLKSLSADDCGITELPSLTGLINLSLLSLYGNAISDLSPLSDLVRVDTLYLHTNLISDLSPLSELISLKRLYISSNLISNLTPLSELIRLEHLEIDSNSIADLSGLNGLFNLKHINLGHNFLSDLSPLAELINLKHLNLGYMKTISDVTPLAGLINLTYLNLHNNSITDVSPLAGLINLASLVLEGNPISDFSPLVNLVLIPSYRYRYIGGPKIEGPWLWVLVPGPKLGSVDLLAEASSGAVTELDIATQGAKTGQAVGNSVWSASKIEPDITDNINIMLNDLGITSKARKNHVIYGVVTLSCETTQDTSMFIGSDDAAKIWLNGELIYEYLAPRPSGNYQEEISVTLEQGTNVLLVAIDDRGGVYWSGYFGFAIDAEYEVIPPDPKTVLSLSTGSAYSAGGVHVSVDDTFTLRLNAEDVVDLAGWQFDIIFNPEILEVVEVTEGDFLKTNDGNTFFQKGTIDNAEGIITGLSAARFEDGVSGTGTLLSITFIAKSIGETLLALNNIQLGSTTAQDIPSGAPRIIIVVADSPAWDVNEDGEISILDLILVANDLGSEEPTNPRSDVNGDGTVSILDLILVAHNIGKSTDSAAPSILTIDNSDLTPNLIKEWITQAEKANDGSITFQSGIANLQNLLASLIPEKTTLLPNYPNPFNPETWIPYQLAKPSDVTIKIYKSNGSVVRTLTLGYQNAGMYQTRNRAAYWNGNNSLGEPVASGVYFYSLTVGDFTATRKMLILK